MTMKPCPFCGCIFLKIENFPAIDTAFIHCLGCDAYVTTLDGKGCLAAKEDKKRIEAIWERREK